MHPSGLLVLTSHISSLCKGDTVSRILQNVKKLVKSTLYVHLNNVHIPPIESKPSWKQLQIQQPNKSFHSDVLPFVTKFYSEASQHCGHMDVNLLLHNIGTGERIKPHMIQNSIDCIMFDFAYANQEESKGIMENFITSNYKFTQAGDTTDTFTDVPPFLPPVYNVLEDEDVILEQADSQNHDLMAKNDAVVLGGTFDRIHSGHKVLLSEAVLLAKRKIVIGVSDGPLLDRKTLKELIEPVTVRKKLLEEFLRQISWPELELHIETILDPYGPSITVPDLDVILVSKETEKGGHLVNEKRKSKGMSQLKVHIIGQGGLLDDSEADGIAVPFEENKASSSTARFRLLGTMLHPAKDISLEFIPRDTCQPYILGLTGGIASGKSSVAKRLEKLGAVIIDCDKLGHKSYLPGSKAFDKIISHFGRDLISVEDGTINRKKLGEKVFSDKSQLEALNGIVWPEIERLCKEEIVMHLKKNSHSNEPTVFVLDAAILLEAGWDKFTHEVWVINVPVPEAVKRVVERNKIPEESVRKRIESQSSNEWRTKQANVVLSTLWEPTVTQRLVEKAWSLLQKRIKLNEERDTVAKRQKLHKL